MPKVPELPGFYYDAEKNRYFPYKGPIPGSSRKPPPPPSNTAPEGKKINQDCKCMKVGRDKLLQAREVYGNVISSRKGKLNFQMEFKKRQASQPLTWKYQGTERMGNTALEHVDVDMMTEHGLIKKEILLTSGSNGSLRILQVGKVGQELDPQPSYMADCVWPLNGVQQAGNRALSRHLWRFEAAVTYMPSDISCIKMLKSASLPIDDSASRRILITALGSDRSNGLVYLLDLSIPLDRNLHFCIGTEAFREIASFKHTLWSAECDSSGRLAAIGTNRGAALLNMDTGRASWTYRSKSDVLSIQFDHSGRSILCGLRNGAIVAVDTRQKQLELNAHNSPVMSMPSSVCCLASLKLYDQFFLASSMDGSIKLYDHRLTQRGPIQSYDGNVNSHTRLGLGVDPSEKFVERTAISGYGIYNLVKCFLRINSWSPSPQLFAGQEYKVERKDRTIQEATVRTIVRVHGLVHTMGYITQAGSNSHVN